MPAKSKAKKNTRKKPSRLGRGLASLMAESVPVQVEADGPALVAETSGAQETPAAQARDGRRHRDDGDDANTDVVAPSRSQLASPDAPDAIAPPVAHAEDNAALAATGEDATSERSELQYIPLSAIRRNEDQPRQNFDAAALQSLADSIASAGLMQPIVVRPVSGDDAVQFEIVAGERRWRAAQLVELKTIPAIVRTLDDQQTAEWALIENLQREDLNPIERALAFEHLHEQFDLDHAEIARRVGLERSTVTNLLRLLSLSPKCQQHIQDGLLAMGHARAIAALDHPELQDQLADKTIREGLSVRKVEQLVKSFQNNEQKPNENGDPSSSPSAAGAAKKAVRSAYLADLEEQLSDQLKTRVRIRPGRKKHSGTLQIDFFTLDQFDDIVAKLGGDTNN